MPDVTVTPTKRQKLTEQHPEGSSGALQKKAKSSKRGWCHTLYTERKKSPQDWKKSYGEKTRRCGRGGLDKKAGECVRRRNRGEKKTGSKSPRKKKKEGETWGSSVGVRAKTNR